MEFTSQTPHVALLATCTPLTIPIGELAKQLILHGGFTATIIALTDNSNSHPQDEYLESLPKSKISHETLPPLSLDDLSDDCPPEHRLAITGERCAPFVEPILEKLSKTTRLVAFIADPACAFATVGLAKKLNVPSFVFFTSSITAFSYCFHLPEIEKKMTCEYRHLTDPLSLPGCVQFEGTDFLHGSQDRASDANNSMVRIFEGYKQADGIMLNSFIELEPEPYKALKEKESKGELPPVYAVGPAVSFDGWDEDETEVLKWLDGQPDDSVLYISFGTGGTLSVEQTIELAYGLEQSGQRFVWVVRWATEKDGSGAFFDLKARKDDVLHGLPEGFVERTKEQGVIVHLWAPQVQILKHRATGGIINNCGWSSVLESICFGVPLIAWPLFGEQRMNAVLLSEGEGGIGVALRPNVGDDGVVSRDEVVNVVRDLFEGEGGVRVRGKVRQLQVAAAAALAKGGSTYEGLSKWCESVAK